MILALVATQALGFRHGIAHAGHMGGIATADMRLASQSNARGGDTSLLGQAAHSCAAFDAATLASVAPVVHDVDLPAYGRFAPLVLAAVDEPQIVVALAYLSRAPPPYTPV